jgi:hypothetical protein
VSKRGLYVTLEHIGGEFEVAQPVYKLFIGKHLEAWHQLSQEEQKSLMAKVNKALEKVNGKRVIVCDPRWCSEQWDAWGVEELPNIGAAQKHAELLKDLNWSRYWEGMSILGTPYQS